jgi:hypothetical protein
MTGLARFGNVAAQNCAAEKSAVFFALFRRYCLIISAARAFGVLTIYVLYFIL